MKELENIDGQLIKSLTNRKLIENTQALVQDERRITIEILRHLREIERRKLFAELGHPSLFSYCTKVLKYSESAACRRIEAMRALRETNEIEAKLETGELSLSTVTHARTVIRQHEKSSGTKVSSEDKKSVMLSLCGRSKRESERQLAAEFPLVASSVPVRQQEISSGVTRITIEFTEDEMKIFDEIKRLSGRPQNLKETVLRLGLRELTRLGKSRGETPVRAKQASSSPPLVVVKKEATSKSPGINLRVFCREHNALSATQILGRQFMARYYPAIE